MPVERINNRIAYTGRPDRTPRSKREEELRREQLQAEIAAGGVAGAAAAKGNYAFKAFKNAEKLKDGSGIIRESLALGRKGQQVVKEAETLFGSFIKNCKKFGEALVNYVEGVKASRYVKPLIDNPIVKAGCKVFGAGLALCFLITGLGTLYNNSAKIVTEFTPKISDKVDRINSSADDETKEAKHVKMKTHPDNNPEPPCNNSIEMYLDEEAANCAA